MDLDHKVNTASKWSLLSEIMSKLMLPITNMVLARLLLPEAFGMVATITMITSFADIFTDAGFQKFLVQNKFESDVDLNNSTSVAFWTNLALSFVLWLVIFFFRNSLAALVGNEGLGDAIAVASLSLPLTSFSSIQMARYKRDLDFKTLFFVKLVGIFVPLFVTIPLAFLSRSFWSLIIGTIATNFINAIILTARSKWKPRAYYNFGLLKNMLGFSMWTLAEQLLGWANANVGIFIVGKFLSDYYLGIYKTSMASANQLLTIIVNAFSPVILSTLSKLKDNNEEYKRSFYTFEDRISIIVLPLGVGIFVYQELFTRILLGAQWIEATSFIGIWALMRSLLIVFGIFSMEVFVSRGVPKYSVLAQVLELLFLLPVLILSAPYGYNTLYICRSAVVIWSIVVKCSLLYYVARLSVKRILLNSIPYIIASLIMGAFGIVFTRVFHKIILQILSVFVCIVIYFSLLIAYPVTRKKVFALCKSIGKKN